MESCQPIGGSGRAARPGSTARVVRTWANAKYWLCSVHRMSWISSSRPEKCGTPPDDAQHDLLAFAAFPQRHWRQIWSTNPLERVNMEIKRRTDVVGVFPNPAALLRLAGPVLIEQHDEWEAGDRRYFSESSMLELKTMNDPTIAVPEVTPLPELIAA